MPAVRAIGPALVVALTAACRPGPGPREAPSGASTTRTASAADPGLLAHAAVHPRALLEPAPGVFVAVGYGLANSILVEGPTGAFVVDAMESASEARAVLEAFRSRSRKPIVALILTHNHADHVFGGAVLRGGPEVPVYAHARTAAAIDRVVGQWNDAIYARSLRMFGQRLEPEDRVGCGIGPSLEFDVADTALARPSHVFEDRLELVLGGERVVLEHAPGETADQLLVWLPDRRILLPGDNVYRAFPNLYTIRGTPPRDVSAWVASLDRMRALRPELLLPSHTLPLAGAEAIEDVLRAYRDAIQFVHDQTVRHANRGLTPDALAERVRLPPSLAAHPWLQERYGSVAWSVRAIFSNELGWFDGRGAHLLPLPPGDRARRFAEAFARAEPIGAQARRALMEEPRWAAELAELWVQAEPDSAEARRVLADALEAIGRPHGNPNARNYLLSEAAELRGLPPARSDPSRAPESLLLGIPTERFLRAMSVRLRAEDTLDADLRLVLRLEDEADWTIHVRRGVAVLERGAVPEPELALTTSSTTWKRLVTKQLSGPAAVASGALRLDGALTDVARFLSWFER